MLKKAITYTLNGEERTENHYFNLTKAEIIDLEISQDGTLSNIIKTLIETEDATKVLAIFKKIVMASYGRRSEDGVQFIKDEQATKNFLSSEAYSEMFIRMLQNPEEANAFFEGLIPAGMAEEVKKRQAEEAAAHSKTSTEQGVSPEVQEKLDAEQAAFKRWQAEQAARAEKPTTEGNPSI